MHDDSINSESSFYKKNIKSYNFLLENVRNTFLIFFNCTVELIIQLNSNCQMH